MDSTVLLHAALNQFDTVHTVSFDYGQRHLKELECIDNTLKNISREKCTREVFKLPFFGHFKGSSLLDSAIEVAKAKDMMGHPQSVNYVPGRNLIFLSILLGYAESVGADTVWYGAAQADSVAGYYDGSQEFLDALNNVSLLNRKHKIKIEAPLLTLSKEQIVEWGTDLKVDFSNTWTCYEGKNISCGACPSCSLRLKGFIDANIQDPLPYAINIPWNKLLL